MNIFIVHAHPEPKSFCSALKDCAADYFISNGHNVKVSDLYSMNFNPVGGINDFKELLNTDYFKFQQEQINATSKDLFVDDIKHEMQKFDWADIIIFNFPLWWFSVPAILKGWVDRIFAMGFAYGAGKGVYENGFFKDKTAFCCITTGGPESSFEANGRNGELEKILFHINHGMFYFVGMKTIEPFVAFSPVRKTDEVRKELLNSYQNYLSSIELKKNIFNSEHTS